LQLASGHLSSSFVFVFVFVCVLFAVLQGTIVVCGFTDLFLHFFLAKLDFMNELVSTK